MKKLTAFLISAGLLMPVQYAQAYGGHWHGDIHRFHEYDMGRWHSGHWDNRFHDGRHGWWWVVGTQWYYYPTPVYPYPDPYIPPTVVMQGAAPSGQYWYCEQPAGYYPYVNTCYTPWRAVAAEMNVPQPVVINQPVVSQPVVVQPQPIEDEGTRDADDRQLNKFAAQFYAIDPKAPGAAAKLQKLYSRVEAYRQGLFERQYNAMDILKDAENLQRRILDQQKKAEHP